MRQLSRATITQKEIAQALGLSQPSVTRALKKHPRLDEATRRRVHAMAQKLGYQANSMAAGLAHFKRSSRVKPVEGSMVWIGAPPNSTNLRWIRELDLYWQGALRSAEKCGYGLKEFIVDKNTPFS